VLLTHYKCFIYCTHNPWNIQPLPDLRLSHLRQTEDMIRISLRKFQNKKKLHFYILLKAVIVIFGKTNYLNLAWSAGECIFQLISYLWLLTHSAYNKTFRTYPVRKSVSPCNCESWWTANSLHDDRASCNAFCYCVLHVQNYT